jgi:hypothetical protein
LSRSHKKRYGPGVRILPSSSRSPIRTRMGLDSVNASNMNS